MRGINLEIDGLSVDTLVDASDSSRLVFNLALHIGKVVKLSVGDVMKFCPFRAAGSGGR